MADRLFPQMIRGVLLERPSVEHQERADTAARAWASILDHVGDLVVSSSWGAGVPSTEK